MCGVVGMIAFDRDFDDIASKLAFALKELQHRGKEASGIVTEKRSFKKLGTPEVVFNKKILKRLGGSIGIGHNLYSTSGKTDDAETTLKRAQPRLAFLNGDRLKPVYFSFNGNLVNWRDLAEFCRSRGFKEEILNDTSAIAALVETAQNGSLETALREEILPRLKYSFCLVFYSRYENKLYIARDPYGFMSLFYGRKFGEFMIAASEDCVMGAGGLNCDWFIEVPRGGLVTMGPAESDLTTSTWTSGQPSRYCLFNFIYFNRPDGTFGGKRIKEVQQEAGRLLAKKHPVDNADVVIPVNDSGLAAAQGYAEVMTQRTGRWMFDAFGLFRPHTTGRAFMEPFPHLRAEGIGNKHRPIQEVFDGKVVVVVDDSVVRGDTMKGIVAEKLLKEGAKEIHVRVASPPIISPCHYGIDTPTHGELVWNHCDGSKECVRAYVGATSLEYLDLEDNLRAVFNVNRPIPRQLNEHSLCTQCFTGKSAVGETKLEYI